MARARKDSLSPLEQRVMNVLWRLGRGTSEDVRSALADTHPMKESTARTILRRIEEKGFVKHQIEGRTYVYEAAVQPEEAAVSAVRRIVDGFCEGSVEALLVGMVEAEMVDSEELARLARRIEKKGREK